MSSSNPASVIWSGIEARSRSANFDRTVPALVHDPLWTLSMQWRMGEFQGEDTGSPLYVRAHMNFTQVNRFSPATGEVKAYDQKTPLECMVMREPVEADLTLQLQLANYWKELLTLHGYTFTTDKNTLFYNAFPIVPAATPQQISNADAVGVRTTVHGRAMDGYALYEFLIMNGGQNATQLADYVTSVSGTFTTADLAAMDSSITDFVAFYKRTYSQPDASESSWNASRMEYAAQCSLKQTDQTGNAQVVLQTNRYHGYPMSWYSFDQLDDPNATLTEDTGQVVNEDVLTSYKTTVLFKGVKFAGLAPERWWQIQEGNYNFASVPMDKTDVLFANVTDLLLGYGHDWGLIPYTVKKGSLSEVVSVVLKDTFNDMVYAGGALDDNATGNTELWNMYGLSYTGSPSTFDKRLFLPPVASKIIAGDPIERVNLLHDEVAAMAWAVEQRIPNELGGSMDGNAAAVNLVNYLRDLNGVDLTSILDELNPPPTGTGTGTTDEEVDGATIRYKLLTYVPENWIPLIPKHVPDSDIKVQLWRAQIPRILFQKLADPGPIQYIQPRGRMMRTGLDEPVETRLSILKEDLPKAGVILERGYYRARGADGSIYTWMGRRRSTGTGPGLSGLEYDLFITGKEETYIKDLDMTTLTDAQRVLLLQSLSPSFVYNNLSSTQRDILLGNVIGAADLLNDQSADQIVTGYNNITDTDKKLDVYFGIGDHLVLNYTNTATIADNTTVSGTSDAFADTAEIERVDDTNSTNYDTLTLELVPVSGPNVTQTLPFTVNPGEKVKVTYVKLTGSSTATVSLQGKYKNPNITVAVTV